MGSCHPCWGEAYDRDQLNYTKQRNHIFVAHLGIKCEFSTHFTFTISTFLAQFQTVTIFK